MHLLMNQNADNGQVGFLKLTRRDIHFLSIDIQLQVTSFFLLKAFQHALSSQASKYLQSFWEW